MKKKILCLMAGISLISNAFGISHIEATQAVHKVHLKLSNGATYFGEVKNGKPNGAGTMKWGANKSYSGSWINGQRSGFGIYRVTDYSNATTNEEGKLVNVEITLYKGYWSNDRQNGNGILKTVLTSDDVNITNVYKGKFVNNSFKTGYSLFSSYLGDYFSYTDEQKVIQFSVYSHNDAQKLSSSNLKNGEIASLSYYNKIKNGYFQGFHVGSEGSASSFQRVHINHYLPKTPLITVCIQEPYITMMQMNFTQLLNIKMVIKFQHPK